MNIFKDLYEDAINIKEKDPACRNVLEAIILYPGFHILVFHRIAHFFYKHKLLFIARLISQIGRFFTGIEIHPGAQIGRRLFIDHGMGIVIGETATVGNDCTIYHNATLGGTGKDKYKRHPDLGNNVMVGSGAKVLGPIKIGNNVKIGANAVVLKDVPPDSTCVGVPGRIVRSKNAENIEIQHKTVDLDHNKLPDPVADAINTLTKHLKENDKHIKILYEKNSICLTEDDEDELDDLLKK